MFCLRQNIGKSLAVLCFELVYQHKINLLSKRLPFTKLRHTTESYVAYTFPFFWKSSPQWGSNSQSLVYKTSALTTKLWRHLMVGGIIIVDWKKQKCSCFFQVMNNFFPTKCSFHFWINFCWDWSTIRNFICIDSF